MKVDNRCALKLLCVVAILLVLIPIFQTPRKSYFAYWVSVSGEGYHSHIQTYEVAASFWILDNFRDEEVLIISDPATSYWLGSLTAKDTLMTEYIDPFMPSEYSNETWTRMEELKQIFFRFGETGSYQRLLNLSSTVYPGASSYYTEILLVLSPHTYYWLYEDQLFPTKVKIRPIDSLAVVSAVDADGDFSLIYELDKLVYIHKLINQSSK